MHKRFFLAPALFAVAAVSAFAQPVIAPDGVTSAASYLPSGLPNSGVAQGSFFFIGGTGLGPSTIVVNSALPYQTTLGGTSVSVTVNGTTTNAFMYYAESTAISAILPSNTPVGTGTLTVTYNNQSATAPITVVKSALGILTWNEGGTGPAVVQNASNSLSGNSLRATLKPNDVGVLYATGLGPVVCTGSCNEANGGGTGVDLRTVDNLDFHLYVGGVEANVLYAGRSGYTGLDQINFTVPAASASTTGCFVPIIARIGTVVSNTGSISIDPNGATCSDPFGLTPAQISQAATGKLTVGTILLTRLGLSVNFGGVPLTITEDQGVARFYNFNGGDPASGYFYSPEHNPDFIGLSSFGSCAVSTCANTTTCVPTSKSLSLPKLDAGASLSVTGGATMVPGGSDGYYHGLFGSYPVAIPPFAAKNYLQAGSFTVSGTGGADVNAFSANINVPGQFKTTVTLPNDSAMNPSLSRSNPLTVTWTPTGNASDYILVSVTSATNAGTIPSGQYNAATITCLQPSAMGMITIPSWILEALPASSPVSISTGTGSPALTIPGGGVLAGVFNLSGTFSSNLNVNLANSLVLYGTAADVQ